MREYIPTKHITQELDEDAPVLVEEVPASHFWQLKDAPETAKVPAEQGVHEAAAAEEYVPGKQVAQDTEFSVDEYAPAAQVEQEVEEEEEA
jgi:hypothetical protein